MELDFPLAPCSVQVSQPLCLVCIPIHSNGAMQPSTLTHHFHSKQGHTKKEGELGDGHRHPKSKLQKLKCCI